MKLKTWIGLIVLFLGLGICTVQLDTLNAIAATTNAYPVVSEGVMRVLRLIWGITFVAIAFLVPFIEQPEEEKA